MSLKALRLLIPAGRRFSSGRLSLPITSSVMVPRFQRNYTTGEHAVKSSSSSMVHHHGAYGHDEETYYPSARQKNGAHVNGLDEYMKFYQESIVKPEKFWRRMCEDFYWEKPWDTLNDVNFDNTNGPVSIKWFVGSKTNLCFNSVDRHVKSGRGGRVAFIFEGNDNECSTMTYQELYDAVTKTANVLKSLGVKKGDTVSIYLPMILELPVAMLACARIGAIHTVVFGGFSADALASRMFDSKAKVLITADGVMRGSKVIALKQVADNAIDLLSEMGHKLQNTLIVKRLGEPKIKMGALKPGQLLLEDELKKVNTDCPVEWLDPEDPCFLLYTSGSTGKPKGVIHTTAGYMVWAATTFKYVFDYRPHDVFWCTADCGWITGHSYITYGPTANAATQVLFEGVPTHPTPARFWDVIDKHKVTQFYTAPTAIRSLMGFGEEIVRPYSLKSLRILGSVGEPINPEAWRWFFEKIGHGRCPIMDTWWQTETGGHMLTPLPGAVPLKPGSATLPFFGVEPVVLDSEGHELQGPCSGALAIKRSWPGQLRGVYGDQQRFESGYFQLANANGKLISNDKYITGDAVIRDKDGYYWITGRIDDVINVSGHRIGTAEVESSLVEHPECVEAAVVGFPHPIKGEAIYAYVTLVEGGELSDELKKELRQIVVDEIGAFAAPDVIHFAPALPKTRSGKIMRRILRKIASGSTDPKDFGDTSTLADPAVVDQLLAHKK